ncbi:pentapeptide repeat-containing protein (plasmid) [Bradyrhizobium barranii subsp. apii]|uniref:Pentapeptide repeat-containing protein n=1 Tax=Bradyrhizobium barranii subsp. apii TaxID=2819348 RepID=A0A8T5VHJ2_9BRAD|nr:pentapeptide repeat-containing protein [Bradyrhizobium barranii]UPT92481.1 pentapeptide repeat-containing protein [Bradyrhizobium barranii subsp. apii]
MKAPNFSTVEFTNVNLAKAQLPSASFAGSSINIGSANQQSESVKWYDFRRWFRTANGGLDRSKPWNEFSSARLKFSQYRDAKIFTTSFAGADLYRAVFDRALLCDVNFSNADLQKASFWGATLDDRTYGWLRKTAWWVAVGWNSHDFEKLLNPQNESQPDLRTQSVGHSPASTAQAQAIRQALRNSERFRKEIVQPIADASAGTFERALALNDMAWTLTTWGIDREISQQTPTSCNAVADANDPLDAAREAICIIEDLKRQGSQDKDYDYWLSTFRDTQAYILMQTDRMPEAKALYEKDKERTEKDGGMLFRYAITLFAVGNEREAAESFDKAIKGMNYVPSDELQNLRRRIPLSVKQMVYDAIDMAYPVPKPTRSCQSRAKPN